jgi:hypothetical protein
MNRPSLRKYSKMLALIHRLSLGKYIKQCARLHTVTMIFGDF